MWGALSLDVSGKFTLDERVGKYKGTYDSKTTATLVIEMQVKTLVVCVPIFTY